MKRAKVSELKSRLSAYLAEVRSGGTVLVCDRQTPIARLVPVDGHADELQLEEPRRPVGDLGKVKPVRLQRRINVSRLLRESRDQR